MNVTTNESFETPRASGLMIKMVFAAALLIIVIGVVYYRSLAALPFAFGVAITSGLNIIKLRMLEKTVHKVVHMDDQEAGKNMIRLQYLLRYFLTGVVLVAVGLISNYTTAPPIYSNRESYFAVWAILFPNAPEALLNSPFISIWGALAGIFTLQLSVIIVRSMKLEKDGDNFIEYQDDDEDEENDATSDIDEYKNSDDNSKIDDEANAEKPDAVDGE